MSNEKAGSMKGLDLRPTLEFYEQHRDTLWPMALTYCGRPFPHEIAGVEHLAISPWEISALYHLFPQAARDRMIVNRIEGRPPTWFHRGSASGQPKSTTERSEALAPTALAPAGTDYPKWSRENPAATVWLAQIPEDVSGAWARRLLAYECAIHEFTHTMLAPLLCCMPHPLRLPGGSVVEGAELFCEFERRAMRHPPFSHYSSYYRAADGSFRTDSGSLTLSIEEELCEAVAAHLLKFVYCDDPRRWTKPFGDRPEVEGIVKRFLAAELVR